MGERCREHNLGDRLERRFGHHRWVYVKILLFSAAGKKMDVFDEKNIYRMSSIVFLRSRSYLAFVVFLCARV